MERSSGRTQVVFVFTNMQWESMEKQSNRVETCPWIFVIGCSSRNPTKEKRKIQPEDFKDRIIFMSMFNGIEWKKNDENSMSNAEKVENYEMRFLQRHKTFLRPRSEEKWYGDSHDQKGQ